MPFTKSVLAFLRVSTEDQSLANQLFEVSSFLAKRGFTDENVNYVTMKGSAFRRAHSLMKQRIDEMMTQPVHERPSEVVFAAVDRFSRDFASGIDMITDLLVMNISVRFARTPDLDISTPDGWEEFQNLLRASELEGINISTRAKIAWERRRAEASDETSVAQKRPRDNDDGDVDMGPPAKRAFQGTPLPYLFLTMSQEQKNSYYRDLLYLIYMFGHDSATVLDLMKHVKKIHKKYSPELQESAYGIRTGQRYWQPHEVFAGTDEDFANILNVYHLSPSGPGAYDRWSADSINAVFERVMPQVVDPQDPILLTRCEFLSLVESYELGCHLPSTE